MRNIFIVSLSFCFLQVMSQGTLYETSFEFPEKEWTHYAESSNSKDPWVKGSGMSREANSGFFAWHTGLNGRPEEGVYSLESPTFDLSKSDKSYYVEFMHKYGFDDFIGWGSTEGNVQINTGDWQWRELESFYKSSSKYKKERIFLDDYKGKSDVKIKFRARCDGSNYGWTIDDFKIVEVEDFDIEAYGVLRASYSHTGFDTYDIHFGYYSPINNKLELSNVYFYYSEDDVFSSDDVLIDSTKVRYSNRATSISKQIQNPGLHPGENYIFYKLDADEVLEETDEINNIGLFILNAGEILEFPFVESFEGNTHKFEDQFDASNFYCHSQVLNVGASEIPEIAGASSGNNALYSTGMLCGHKLVSPRIKASFDDLCVNFFARTTDESFLIEFQRYLNDANSYSKYEEVRPYSNSYPWKNYNVILDTYGDYKDYQFTFNLFHEAVAIDDIYIGPYLPDIHVPILNNERFFSNDQVNYNFKYHISNVGNKDALTFENEFYISTDSSFSLDDIMVKKHTHNGLDSISESQDSIVFNPTLYGDGFYLIMKVDTKNQVEEMRENNNHVVFKFNRKEVHFGEFVENFETDKYSWNSYNEGGHLSWEKGKKEEYYNKFINGNYLSVSIPSDTTQYAFCHFVSPILDLSILSAPTLSFDVDFYKSYGNSSPTLYVQYSTDNGFEWKNFQPSEHIKGWNLNFLAKEVPKETSYSLFVTEKIRERSINRDVYNSFYKSSPLYPIVSQLDQEKRTNCILRLDSLEGYDNLQIRFSLNNGVDDITNVVNIDNIQILEGGADLALGAHEVQYLNAEGVETNVNFFINNLGNNRTDSSKVDVYLSEDTLLDPNDKIVISDKSIERIFPDSRSFNLVKFIVPSNVGNKRYILFDIDSKNTVYESNETNNIDYHIIASSGVSSFPYLENFDSPNLDGWKNYWNDGNGQEFRFSKDLIGRMFTVRYPSYYDYESYTAYMESPVFNFTDTDSVYISLDIFIGSGSSKKELGAFIDYSIDGGVTWSKLGKDYQEGASNWYSDHPWELDVLGMWRGCEDYFVQAVFDATNFVKNNNNVIFRICQVGAAYCSHLPNAFSFDNFKVSTSRPYVDFKAVDVGKVVTMYSRERFPEQYIPITVTNLGNTPSTPTLEIKYSTDTIYNENNYFFKEEINLQEIQPNDTLVFYIRYANDISVRCDSQLYLNYTLNSKTGSLNTSKKHKVFETDYENNFGFLKVNRPDIHNYIPHSKINISGDTNICYGESLYIYPIIDSSKFDLNLRRVFETVENFEPVEITESGIYNLTVGNSQGCQVFTDSIIVDVKQVSSEIIIEEDPEYCYGDSLLLRTESEGVNTWNTGSQQDSIFAYTGGIYTLVTTTPEGCSAKDSVALTTTIVEHKPLVLTQESFDFCGEIGVIWLDDNYSNIKWNTGDTTRLIKVSSEGEYFATIDDICGIDSSNSVQVKFSNFSIDSVSQFSIADLCEGDTVVVEAYASQPFNIEWADKVKRATNTLYSTQRYEEGESYTPDQYMNWEVIVSENDNTVSLRRGNRVMDVSNNSDTVTIVTDPVYIPSQVFSLELTAFADINYSGGSKILVYYKLNGDSIIRFTDNDGIIDYRTEELREELAWKDEYDLIQVIVKIPPGADFTNFGGIRVFGNSYSMYGEYTSESNQYEHIVNSGQNSVFAKASYNSCVEYIDIDFPANEYKKGQKTYSICDNTLDTIQIKGFPEGYRFDIPLNYGVTELIGNDKFVLDLTSPYFTPQEYNRLFVDVGVETTEGCFAEERLSLYLKDFAAFNINESGNKIKALAPDLGYNYEYDYSIEWYDCSSNKLISGETNKYIVKRGGISSYYAKAEYITDDSYVCRATSNCVTVIGVDDEFDFDGGIYPNPVVDILFYTNVKQGEVLELYSLTGAFLQKWDVSTLGIHALDLQAYSSGVYLLKIFGEGGDVIKIQNVFKD